MPAIPPIRLWFFCIKPAEFGGETPIADVRRVFERIDPVVRQKFIEKGWMLVRNYSEKLSLPWQTVFRSRDKESVEEYCNASDIEWEWVGENHLRTRQIRPAAARHPKTNEWVWFNHIAFWHLSSLNASVRDVMVSDFKENGVPYNTYYGDGSKIDDSIVEIIREAYRSETICFPWHKGDVLMLDNLLVAHGRNPFRGERKVLSRYGRKEKMLISRSPEDADKILADCAFCISAYTSVMRSSMKLVRTLKERGGRVRSLCVPDCRYQILGNGLEYILPNF